MAGGIKKNNHGSVSYGAHNLSPDTCPSVGLTGQAVDVLQKNNSV